MASISEHIGSIRGNIRKFSDDTEYTDEFLYMKMNNHRNMLMYRKMRQNIKMSQWNKKAYCLGLEKTLSHDCNCVKVGCEVLKSVFAIPRPLTSRNRDIIKVYTLAHKEIPYVTIPEQEINIWDEIKSGRLAWSLYNQKIVLWNSNLKIKAIVVEGIWEDETKWTDIQYCDSNGVVIGNCFDIDTTEYGIDPELVGVMYELTLKELGFSLQIQADTNGDSQEKPELEAR